MFNLIRLIESPAALYVILRYFTYGLQFLNSILLVNVLGDYSYGIYGFILMFSVYAIYFNLGLNESLNAEYAINKSNKIVTSQLWSNTLFFAIIWYCFITIATLLILHCVPGVFSKYEFSSYGNLLTITCTIHNISTLFATLYKIHGKIVKVNIQQLIPQVGILLVILMGKHIASVEMIVIALFVVADVKEGDVLTEDNVKAIRPFNGILPKYLKDVLGKKFVKSVERGTPLSFDLLN